MPVWTHRNGEGSRRIVVFALSDHEFALPLEGVVRIVPMAELTPIPGAPPFLEGLLNLGGDNVPVLRVDRLLDLPPARVPGLYTPIILLKNSGAGHSLTGLLVEKIAGIFTAQPDAVAPLAANTTFNDCVAARVTIRTEAPSIPLLDPERLLLREERERIAFHAARAQERRGALAAETAREESAGG